MKVVGFVSGKGGVGKTTSAVNLAASLNRFGKEVIVVDGNVTTPNVGVHLGQPVADVHLHHVLKGKANIHEALQQHPQGFSFIPGGLSINDLEGLRLHKLKAVKKLSADYVILDGAAGLGAESLHVMKNSDELFVVTNAELPAVTDALKTVKLAEEMGKEIKGVILTRVKQDDLDMSIANVEALLEIPVVSVVPEDDSLREALTLKDAVVHTHPESRASRAYMKLAANMSGTALPDKKKLTFTQKFIAFLKKNKIL